MAGLDHRPAAPPEEENAQSAARRTRYGRWMFLFYLLFYGGFVLLNAFVPSEMERTPWAGVNLAVLYGLALIATAFLIAVAYDWLCRFLDRQGPGAGEGGR